MRKKRMLSGNEYYNYINSAKYGYTHQYVRNVLQLNSGPIPGHILCLPTLVLWLAFIKQIGAGARWLQILIMMACVI